MKNDVVDFLENVSHGPCAGANIKEFVKWAWRNAAEILRKDRIVMQYELKPVNVGQHYSLYDKVQISSRVLENGVFYPDCFMDVEVFRASDAVYEKLIYGETLYFDVLMVETK